MSDLGDLIQAPLPTNTSRGDLTDLAKMVYDRFLFDRDVNRENIDLRTMDNLNQQNGFAQGVNPFDIQKFGTNELNNTIARGDFDARQLNNRQTQEFTQNFMNAARGNQLFANDPAAQLYLQAGVNPHAAEGLNKLLMGNREFDNSRALNKDQLASREAMNASDNAAAKERAQMQLDYSRQGDENNYSRKEREAQAERDRIAAAIKQGMETGDMTGAITNGLSGPAINYIQSEAEKKAAAKQAADAEARKNSDTERSKQLFGAKKEGKSLLSPEQKSELALAEVNKYFSNMPADQRQYAVASMAAGDSKADPAGRFWKGPTMSAEEKQKYLDQGRAAFGSNFDQIYTQIQQELLRQQQLQEFENKKASISGNKSNQSWSTPVGYNVNPYTVH